MGIRIHVDALANQQKGADAAQALNQFKAFVLSAEGKAGMIFGGMLVLEIALLGFAVAGGAFGARLIARTRRPQG